MIGCSLRAHAAGSGRQPAVCPNIELAGILLANKTRQGYARKRILKPAGYFFVGRVLCGGASWQQ